MKNILDSANIISNNDIIFANYSSNSKIHYAESQSNSEIISIGVYNNETFIYSADSVSNNSIGYVDLINDDIIGSIEVFSDKIYYADTEDQPKVSAVNLIDRLYSSIISFIDLVNSNNSIEEILIEDNSKIRFVDILDNLYIILSKLTDSFTIEELQEFVFDKSLSDIFKLVENTSFELSKIKEELVFISDNISVSLNKQINDEISLQDSFSIIVQYNRELNESINCSEILVFYVSKLLRDRYTIRENISKQLTKNKFDYFRVFDSSVNNLNKGLLSTFNFNDNNHIFSFTKNITDTIIPIEEYAFSLEKTPFDDLYSISDSSSGWLNKVLNEKIYFTDYSEFEFDKQVLDLPKILESYSFNLVKAPFSDSINISESGNVFLHSYSSNSTYFLGNYVGDETSFIL